MDPGCPLTFPAPVVRATTPTDPSVCRQSSQKHTPRWTVRSNNNLDCMGTCAATNKDGTPCGNDAMSDSQYCHVHQDLEVREQRSTPAQQHGFGTLMAGALLVVFVVYFLLKLLLGL